MVADGIKRAAIDKRTGFSYRTGEAMVIVDPLLTERFARSWITMHAVTLLVAAIASYAAAQQTFQSTIFDLPAELPAEDYALLSQIDDVPQKKNKQIAKPKKIDKAALNVPQVEPPTYPPSLAQPQIASQPPSSVTPVPFFLTTYPTLPTAPHLPFTMAPLSLPTLPPPPSPFTLPTHPTMSPFTLPSHPTLPPFTFPTHPTIPPFTATPLPQLQPSGIAQYPQIQHIGSPPHVLQPPQQFQQYGSQPQNIQPPQQFQQFAPQPQAIPPPDQFHQFASQSQAVQPPQHFQQIGSQPQAIQPPQEFQQFGSQPQSIQAPQQFQLFGSQPRGIQQPQQQYGESPLYQPPYNYRQRNDGHTPFQTQSGQPMHYQPAQPQGQMQQSILQPQQQSRIAEHPQVQYGGFPQQPLHAQSQFPQYQQLVAPTPSQQPQQLRPPHQQHNERNHGQPSFLTHHPQNYAPPQSQTQQLAQPETSQFNGFQPNQHPQHRGQVVASGQTLLSVPQSGTSLQQNRANTQNYENQSGLVERVSNSTPNRFSMWFKEDFDTVDDALADLVERRLMECDRKSSANHWHKVDGLLAKISLSKSGQRTPPKVNLLKAIGNGATGVSLLVRNLNAVVVWCKKRISCLNLLHYVCQFVHPSFTFRLVPARITIEEARQAESGAEKCRKVVRLVKKRLEG